MFSVLQDEKHMILAFYINIRKKHSIPFISILVLFSLRQNHLSSDLRTQNGVLSKCLHLHH